MTVFLMAGLMYIFFLEFLLLSHPGILGIM